MATVSEPAVPAGIDASDWRDMLSEGVRSTFADGELICTAGDACKGWPFVVRGAIRMYTMSEDGRELTLYRIEPGMSCILTATCILGERPFPAFASAIGETEVVILPPAVFQKWFHTDAGWRQHVCGLLTERLVGVISSMQEVAFHGVDRRLAAFLLRAAAAGDAGDGGDGTNGDRSGPDRVVRTTHAAAAADLGTSREVVSRILKAFERRGLLRIERGRVVLLDAEGLGEISDPGW